MSVAHSLTPVTSSTPADLISGVVDKDGYHDLARSVIVKNEGLVSVFLGGPTVTASGSGYGYELGTGKELAMDLTPTDVLYGITATGGSSQVRVLHLGV